MTTQAVCKYTINATGTVDASQFRTAMASGLIPVDYNLLNLFGLRVLSDAITGAGNAIRTITLGFTPSSTATAAAFIGSGVYGQNGTQYGPITSLILDTNGLDYVRPPLVTIVDATGKGASATSTLGVYAVAVNAAGMLYSAPTVTAVGGELAPGGVPATFSVTLGLGGTISSVSVTNNGGPYSSPPKLVITDAAGSGGILTARMGVSTVKLIKAGQSYSAPSVVFTPYFKALFPDGTNQVSRSRRSCSASSSTIC